MCNPMLFKQLHFRPRAKGNSVVVKTLLVAFDRVVVARAHPDGGRLLLKPLRLALHYLIVKWRKRIPHKSLHASRKPTLRTTSALNAGWPGHNGRPSTTPFSFACSVAVSIGGWVSRHRWCDPSLWICGQKSNSNFWNKAVISKCTSSRTSTTLVTWT